MEQPDKNNEIPRWQVPPGFIERFAKRRDIFLDSLSGAVRSLDTVVCRPMNGAFYFV